MGLLKFLFIAIAILWLLRILARLLFPWAMRKMAQKVMGDAQGPYQYRPYQDFTSRQRQPDGKIRIDYVPPQHKSATRKGAKNAGEFVEFEEIKSSAK